MSIYLIAFLADVVVFFVASIWLLVRAFRVSIMWGLIALFVPLGRIVFAFVHWNEGARLLFVQLASLGIAIALIVASPLREEFRNERSRHSETAAAPPAQSTPREVRDLAEPTATPAPRPVDPVAAQRAAYAKHAQELNTLYQQLNTERPGLKPGSPAVAAFNARAAKYQQGIQALAEEKARLDALDRAPNPTPTPPRN